MANAPVCELRSSDCSGFRSHGDADESVAARCGASMWHEAADASDCHIAILDKEGGILAVTAAWRRFSEQNGGDPAGYVGCNYFRACEPNAAGNGEESLAVSAGIREVLDGKRSEFSLVYPCHSPVEQRWFMLRAARINGNGPGRAVVRHENVTFAEAFEAEATRILEQIVQNELLTTVLHGVVSLLERKHTGVHCGIMLKSEDQPEVIVSQGCPAGLVEEIRARATAAMSGDFTSSLIQLANAVGRDRLNPPNAKPDDGVVAGSRGCWPQVFRLHPIRNSQKELAGCLVLCADTPYSPVHKTVCDKARSIAAIAISHAAMRDKLSLEAWYDPVTELPNRFVFQDRLQNALRRGQSRGFEFAVLTLDLDHFELINDAYGRRVGDTLLREVAQRLHRSIGAAGLVARLGGDEFGIVVDSPDAAQEADTMSRAIVEGFQAPFSVVGKEICLTCSVGASIFPVDTVEAAELVHKADTARNQVKRSGRNNWKRFDAAVEIVAQERKDIERNLREAVKSGRGLHLVYQPQTDSRERIIGVEALLRWDHPVLGRVSPSRFIPIAEENGLIVEIGCWVLREACLQAVRWKREGFDVRMSVNASTVQVCRSDFAETVTAIIAETGVDPESLELEITESALMRDLDDGRREMDKVRRLGVKMSIDDFGTGYSSLHRLQGLPVETIKIDQSFVRELEGGSRSAVSVIQAIVTLAHDLNLTVVAEGVETRAQIEILKSLGCDVFQGYLLHRPLMAESVSELLQAEERVPKEVVLPSCGAGI